MSARQPRLAFEGEAPAFDAAEAAAAGEGEALVLELDGFEGPLHLLLELARRQKVDLLTLSVAELADQYLRFVAAARRRRFALAADYLVMAAWLAYLKSRLLLPRREAAARSDEPPADALAAALAARLQRLDGVRRAVAELQERPQLGRDVFPRGAPEAPAVVSATRVRGDLAALVAAYARGRVREAERRYAPRRRVEAFPLEAARERLRALLPRLEGWTALEQVTPAASPGGPSAASCLASTFAAGLEMAKEGALEVRQRAPYAELHLRRRQAEA